MSSITSAFSTSDGWHRVHWLRLVELLARAAFGAVVLLWSGIPGSIGSWAEQAFGFWLGVSAFTTYFSTRYRITENTIASTKGVVFRSEETMRRDDVQSITTDQPIWFRPFNLMQVKVADNAGNDIVLGPVSASVAGNFAAALTPDSDSAADDDRSTADLEVNARRIDVPMWKVFLASAFDLSLLIAAVAVGITAYFGWWIAMASVLLIYIGVPIVETISTRLFRLTITGDEIRTRAAVFPMTTENHTTRQRSEFLRVDETLAFRLLGLERVVIGTADDVIVVMPIQRRGEWRQLAPEVIDTPLVDESTMVAISARSVPRFRLIGAALAVAIGGIVALVDWRFGLAAGVMTAAIAVVWYPTARLKRFGMARSESSLMARTGVVLRRIWLCRLDRIDASAVSSTPSQRRNTLATLRFCGRNLMSTVVIPDLDAAVACQLDASISASEEAPDVAVSCHSSRPADAAPAVERRDQTLPPAAVTAAVVGVAIARVVAIMLWAALMVGAWATAPADSLWRSPWLVWGGAAVIVAFAIVSVPVTWLRARSERWSMTGRLVERRRGVVIDTTEVLKRSRIATASWSQGPVERRYGLASVNLISRGVINPDLRLSRLDADDARELADLHSASSREEPGPTATP